MDFGLTSEQQMVVDTVRGFVEQELYPHEEEVERTGQVPPGLGEEIKRKVIDLGFYAPNLPVGGRRRRPRPPDLHPARTRARPRVDGACGVFWGRPSGILMGCEGEQRERYLLPAARAGERFDALAMTEPGAGSDVRGMQCFARRDGGDWVVNGTKHFISHADLADFVIVFVATGEEETARGPKKRITCFLVDRGAPGFEIRPGYDSVSRTAATTTASSPSTTAGCRTRRSSARFIAGSSWRTNGSTRRGSRSRRAAWGGRGGCSILALTHAAKRRQFGQPIGRFQGVSFKLADMITEIDAAELADPRRRVAPGIRRFPADREIASAKMYASEMLARGDGRGDPDPRRDGVDERPSAGPASGATPVSSASGTGTSEIQRHIIGRDLLRPLGA